ncbi:hypothetical protein SAMN05421504_108212 [Amycolatopsis xylanica]|uniref:DUF4267 domain-containing protein n=1 Tax=Amycolatopsis xylanica TaxID=589385 RepID=A0A1H3PGX4_9PSEU|nr:hypothetical protein [Amycolatopsis xylanica]SDZ00400.1 hypothetical protein SAMN05421504_108212 [Amycolatopsis xylanica]
MPALSRPAAFIVVGVRIAVSLAFAALPDRTMTGLFGVPAKGKAAKAVAVHYVLRDLALGAGLWRALLRRRGERAWMVAGTVADIVDYAAIVATASRKKPTEQKFLIAQMSTVVILDCAIAATVGRAPVND